MFIAHLPAGYLAANLLTQKNRDRRGLIAVGLACSILPDLDLLWFYLVDNRHTAHHEYVFHWPMFWCFLAMISWLLVLFMGRTDKLPYVLIGLTCLLLHMVLDSFAAEIYWFRPFSNVHLNAVKVPARFDWWGWSFLFHWTFAVELAICAAAAIVYLRRPSATTET